MDMTDEERHEKTEEFKQEMLGLLHKYSPYLGPQMGDAGVFVNNEQTLPTDVILVVNWMDMESSNSFLSGIPVSDTGESTMIGMLWRIMNMIG